MSVLLAVSGFLPCSSLGHIPIIPVYQDGGSRLAFQQSCRLVRIELAGLHKAGREFHPRSVFAAPGTISTDIFTIMSSKPTSARRVAVSRQGCGNHRQGRNYFSECESE